MLRNRDYHFILCLTGHDKYEVPASLPITFVLGFQQAHTAEVSTKRKKTNDAIISMYKIITNT